MALDPTLYIDDAVLLVGETSISDLSSDYLSTVIVRA